MSQVSLYQFDMVMGIYQLPLQQPAQKQCWVTVRLQFTPMIQGIHTWLVSKYYFHLPTE
jgi:hypothetical protein